MPQITIKFMKFKIIYPIVVLFLIIFSKVNANLSVNGVFSDNMVLQRETHVAVWGTASAGSEVVVSFAGQLHKADTNSNGHWLVYLDPMHANANSSDLIVSNQTAKQVFHNVVVGEVWLAGGQSNMGYPLFAAHNSAEVLPKAVDPLLRFLVVPMITSVIPKESITGAAWKQCTPDSARNFSAVAYFFAKELRVKLNCPIGVISAAWGGTPIETWISLDALKVSPQLSKTIKDYNMAMDKHLFVLKNPTLASDYEASLKKWKKEVQPAYDLATKSYNADKDSGKQVGKKPEPAWAEPQNPDPTGMPSPSRRPQVPAISFNGMIAPLAPYVIRGFIWYQGEANGAAGLEYRKLFPRLIKNWRDVWGAELPFLYVQLPACYEDPVPVAVKGWPWLREAQAMTQNQNRVSMAVTIDVGDPNNVHPTDKSDVGHRLALLARRDVYGENTLVATGPKFNDYTIVNNSIRVHFTNIGSGLVAGQAPWRARGVEPLPLDHLIGFYIAGSDHVWKPAKAVIDQDSVILNSDLVTAPIAVRYAWANSPRCNLYNKEGLPAAPFRTDNWEK
jgi:sialate O-acetylesterase